MKKILFVIPTMRMGGAEQSLVSLLNTIDLTKYQVDLLLFERDGVLLERLPKQISVKETDVITRAMLLEFHKYFGDLLKTKKVLAIVARIMMLINSKIQNITGCKKFFNWTLAKKFIEKRSEEYDVAVGYLEGVTDCYVIDKVHAKKKVGWIHTDISKQKRSYVAEGKYYEAFDQIAIISDECKKKFLEYYPSLEAKTQVIENITNATLILKKSLEAVENEFLSDSFCIVTVGRLEKEKGIDIAVSAAKLLYDKGIPFKWHVFGDGIQKDELQIMIKQLQLDDIFVLEGTTKNPYKYMREADLVVQPSRYEGKSIVLDEAKILAKPIVVTNYPSAKDQIIDKVTGLVVDIEANAIASGIENLLHDEKLRCTLSENCLQLKNNTKEIINRIDMLLEG